ELGAMLVRRFGGAVIRGSSTHTGARALRDYYPALARGGISPVITPDGPPRHPPGHPPRRPARPALQVQAGRAAARADVAAADPADGVRGLARLAGEVGQVRDPGALARAHRHRDRGAALRRAGDGRSGARAAAGGDGARAPAPVRRRPGCARGARMSAGLPDGRLAQAAMLPPLVMRCGAFGDMVLLTVLLEQLHARFGRRVDVIASGPWSEPLL